MTKNKTMEKIYNRITEEYKANGEDNRRNHFTRYATLFINKDDVEEIEWFEESFEVDIDEVNFPIITFDTVGTGGKYFEYREDEYLEEDIMKEANDFFETKLI